MVMPRFSTVQSGEKMKSLGIFLQCTPEGEGSSWSCHASAKITVINQKSQEESFTRSKFGALFCGCIVTWLFLCTFHNEKYNLKIC